MQYSAEHEWVDGELAVGADVTVGITEHAADALGDIVYVEAPAVGGSVTAGEVCGELESTKAVSELYSPVTGTVTAVNEELASDAGDHQRGCVRTGWIFKVDLSEAAGACSTPPPTGSSRPKPWARRAARAWWWRWPSPIRLRCRGCLLAARRNAPAALAGLWEFPGGKVERGETVEGALRRELREELGIEVALGDEIPGPDDGGDYGCDDARVDAAPRRRRGRAARAAHLVGDRRARRRRGDPEVSGARGPRRGALARAGSVAGRGVVARGQARGRGVHRGRRRAPSQGVLLS